MITTLFLALSLGFQGPILLSAGDPLDVFEAVYDQQRSQSAPGHASDRPCEAFLEHKFEIKYNDVAKALADFGETWNHKHEVDRGQVERLKKAWRDLGKTDPWFDTSRESN